MNAETPPPSGLALLREPFPPHQISKLPKPTKQQTEAVRADFKAGTRCEICGTWHHPKVVHLDYVGHAALTDRLLDADPAWSWEPLAMTADGLPVMDPYGGMWIKLTVCGVTRLGYGDAQEKSGPNGIKEVIGDALRNAAMRFGAALDLWHKGNLHDDAADEPAAKKNEAEGMAPDVLAQWITYIKESPTSGDMKKRVAEAAKEAMSLNDGKAIDHINATADVMATAARAKASGRATVA